MRKSARLNITDEEFSDIHVRGCSHSVGDNDTLDIRDVHGNALSNVPAGPREDILRILFDVG